MKHLMLYEKFVVESDPAKMAALSRIKKVGSARTIVDYLFVIVKWFNGGMMGVGSDMPEVVNALRKVGLAYDHNLNNKNVYRTAHLYLDQPGLTPHDIRNIKTGTVGPRDLQSWSTHKDGAEWFFTHFVRDQNRMANPKSDTAWVIVKTNLKDLDVLITFEECMQFMADVAAAYDYVQGHMEDVSQNDLRTKLEAFNSDEMIKLHEVICVVPKQLEFDVVDVKVAPNEDAVVAPDIMKMDDLTRLLSFFVRQRNQE